MKLYFKILSMVLVVGILGSCKPDTNNLLSGNEDSYSAVYMPQAVNKQAIYTFNISAQPETIIYGANFGGPNSNSTDIDVKFEPDLALVNTYNAANFTQYPVMPEGSYKLEQTSAIIPSGKTSTNPLKLSIYTDKLDGVGAYLLPLSIKSNYRVKEALRTTYFLVSAKYTSNPFADFDRSNWSVLAFSSDENENASGGRIQHAFDGNVNTFWSTAWRNTKPGPPHFVTIDMGTARKIHGFKIAGRLDNGQPRTTGNPKDIIIQTGNDGINWTYSQAVSLQNLAESTIYLNYAQTARYFKITINSSQSDNYLTHIAELNAF